MISVGMGPQPGQIRTLGDALDSLNDAAMWARALDEMHVIMADGGGCSCEFRDQALTEAMAAIAGGIAKEIEQAVQFLAKAQGRDLETEVEALAVIAGGLQ